MNATVSFPALATQPRAHHPFPWRVFGVLLLAALLGTMLLHRERPTSERSAE